MVFDDTFPTVGHTRKRKTPGNWKNLIEEHSELATQENIDLAKYWHLNKSSSMPLYPGRPGKKTHCNQVPKIYFQGLISRSHPEA